MMTFLQAMYVLTPLVHNNNTSAVIDPLLTKTFWTQFFGTFFLDKFSFWAKRLLTPKFFGPTFFFTKIFSTKTFRPFFFH